MELTATASYFMLLGGVLLAYLEFLKPGMVVPGVAGGVAAMWGLSRLVAHWVELGARFDVRCWRAAASSPSPGLERNCAEHRMGRGWTNHDVVEFGAPYQGVACFLCCRIRSSDLRGGHRAAACYCFSSSQKQNELSIENRREICAHGLVVKPHGHQRHGLNHAQT